MPSELVFHRLQDSPSLGRPTSPALPRGLREANPDGACAPIEIERGIDVFPTELSSSAKRVTPRPYRQSRRRRGESSSDPSRRLRFRLCPREWGVHLGRLHQQRSHKTAAQGSNRPRIDVGRQTVSHPDSCPRKDRKALQGSSRGRYGAFTYDDRVGCSPISLEQGKCGYLSAIRVCRPQHAVVSRDTSSRIPIQPPASTFPSPRPNMASYTTPTDAEAILLAESQSSALHRLPLT